MDTGEESYPVKLISPNVGGIWFDRLLLIAAQVAFVLWVMLFFYQHRPGSEIWLLIAVVAFGFWRVVVLLHGPWISEDAQYRPRKAVKDTQKKTRR